MNAKCIKEYENDLVKVGEIYKIIDADMYEYLILVNGKEIWISKNDIEHFEYHV